MARTRWAPIRPGDRYGLVIALIVASYLAAAAVDENSWSSVVLLIQVGTVWLAFSVSESRRAQRVAAGVFGLGSAALVLAGIASPLGEARLGAFLLVTSASMYLVAPVVIVRHIFRRPVIDRQTLLGAVAAYLLIGMMFAFVYRAVGAIQTDPPFFGASGPGSMADALFFSFVTLTTTGYGNLTPAANPGQSLAVLEAIVGQLFLVTAVARIVTGWTPHGMTGLGSGGSAEGVEAPNPGQSAAGTTPAG